MNAEIRLLEELPLNAHPALHTMFYDGWILRFADGYTNRANSVNMLYPAQVPLDDKIDFCESIYAKENLPAVFKITPLSADVDVVLAERGYSVVTPTNLMVMDIGARLPAVLNSSTVSEGISGAWQSDYFRLNQTNAKMIPAAKQMQGNIMPQTLTATLSIQNETAACGLCVIEQGCAGLYDIVVSPAFRRNGYGRDICTALLNTATKYGAKKAYLQVVAENTGAIVLYEKLGFKNLYQYWYRVKKQTKIIFIKRSFPKSRPARFCRGA